MVKKIFFSIFFMGCFYSISQNSYEIENIYPLRKGNCEYDIKINKITNIENNKSTYINYDNPLSFRIYNGRIYIHEFYNFDYQRLLVFGEKNGKFLYKIDHNGDASYQYGILQDFDIDNINNVTILDTKRNKVLEFNDKGEFIQSEVIKSYDDLFFDGFIHLKNNATLFSIEKERNAINKPKLVLYKDKQYLKKSIGGFAEFDPEYFLDLNLFRRTNEKIYFSRTLHDSIYEINSLNGSLDKIFVIDFEDYNIPFRYRLNHYTLSKYSNNNNFTYNYGGSFFELKNPNLTIMKINQNNKDRLILYSLKSNSACSPSSTAEIFNSLLNTKNKINVISDSYREQLIILLTPNMLSKVNGIEDINHLKLINHLKKEGLALAYISIENFK